MTPIKKVFSTLLAKSIQQGIKKLTQQSVIWFNQYVRQNLAKQVTIAQLQGNKQLHIAPKLKLGKMYFFAYDAKHKDKLPYWDAAPLVIPISETKTSIIGLNLHYLPIPYRAKLLDALYDLLTNDKMDDTTRIRVTYQMLQSAAKYRYFRPCIKEYLKSNFQSRFIEVPVAYWETAIFLPVADWQKASKDDVYKDSLRIIRGK